jgi:lysophospholipase L1-like esterase
MRLALALLAAVALAGPASQAHAANDGGLMSILVMGDSYSAGNGAGGYYGAKGCRRSAYNYARQYARFIEQAPYNQRTFVENVACSGDTTEHFFKSRNGRRPQVNAVDAGYDLILLTIGGNDLKFSKIVKFCLIQVTRDGANCGPLLTEAERALKSGGLRKRISDILRSIRSRADRRARIVLLGYPYLEGDAGYRLRSGHGGRTFIEAGKRLHRLTNAGDRLQRGLVERLNDSVPGHPFAFVSTRRLFTGPPDHSLYAQKTNRHRWFVQPLVDVANIDYDLFYHPNRTGWTQEARLLVRTSSVPKLDLNSDVPPIVPTPVPPGPPPVERVTRIVLQSPASGPTGYQPTITGPECVAGAGEQAVLRRIVAGQSDVMSSFEGLEVNGWRIGVNLTPLEAGTHHISFACVAMRPGGEERVIWSDPGFDITLFGPARETKVQSSTVRPGDEVGVISGASQGPDPCPAIAGAVGIQLHISIHANGVILDAADLQLPTITAFEPLDVPVETPVGTHIGASAHCFYQYADGAGAGFDFRTTFVTAID